jgi:hypothetical protein
MNTGIGDDVRIDAAAGVLGGGATCVVDETANVPGLEELQTFASVIAQPVSVACEMGFTMQSGP